MTKEKPIKKLTIKELTFIDEYMLAFNATEAYMIAYPKCKQKTANTEGCKVLVRPAVREEINKRSAERSKTTMVDAKYCIDKMKTVQDANYVKYIAMGEEGVTKAQLDAIPEDICKMITECKQSKTSHGTGKDRVVEITYTFKLMDKTKVLDMLNKSVGIYRETKDINLNGNLNISFSDIASEID